MAATGNGLLDKKTLPRWEIEGREKLAFRSNILTHDTGLTVLPHAPPPRGGSGNLSLCVAGVVFSGPMSFLPIILVETFKETGWVPDRGGPVRVKPIKNRAPGITEPDAAEPGGVPPQDFSHLAVLVTVAVAVPFETLSDLPGL